jgi:hypothetical protein
LKREGLVASFYVGGTSDAPLEESFDGDVVER